MEIALQLRLADHPVRETVAWLLTSSDHSFWLDEVCTQDSALSRIRLFPLPKSRTDITVGSVLVVSESSHSMSRGIPFGCLCGQVYLPQCAEIVPPLKQDELRTLLLPDYEYVWHPGLGMIAFTEDEYILVADLLQVQKPKAMKTDLAQMGLAFPNRVHSMTAVVSIDDLADLFQQEQNEIGDKSSQIDELPNVPDEPTDQILENAKQRLDQAVARAAQWFTGLFPKVEGDEANWLSKLESWAQEKLVQARSRDDFLRHKEIERLVHLLDSDPDNGLRYALPFGGNLHRGVGDASNRLVPRKVDFSLRGTGGQGDVWDVGAKYEQIHS